MKKFLAFAFLILLTSCTVRYTRIDDKENVHKHLNTLIKHNQKIYQIKTTLNIKAYGLLGSFFHEQGDLIVQRPNLLYWSLRSFIGSPSFVVASNGDFITLYDFENAIRPYTKIPTNSYTNFELYDFPFNPKILADIFILNIPIKNADSHTIYKSGQLLRLDAKLKDGWHYSCTFDLKNQRMLFVSFKHQKYKVSYTVKYKDYKYIKGVYFPTLHIIDAQSKEKSIKLKVMLENTKLNKPPLSKNDFYLQID